MALTRKKRKRTAREIYEEIFIEFQKQKKQLIQETTNEFLATAQNVQAEIFDVANSLVATLGTQNGRIAQTADNLAVLDNIGNQLWDTLVKSQYERSVVKYIQGMQRQKILIDGYMDKSFPGWSTSEFADNIYEMSKKEAAYLLSVSTVRTQWLRGYEKIIQDAITQAKPFTTTVREIRRYGLGDAASTKENPPGENIRGRVPPMADGKLLKYSKQIAYDSMAISDRTYTDSIIKLTEFYFYAGGELETSRPFCIERNDKYFHEKEIEKWAELDWQGKTENTNKVTIFRFAGGYNCRHTFIPASVDVVPPDVLERNKSNGNYVPKGKLPEPEKPKQPEPVVQPTPEPAPEPAPAPEPQPLIKPTPIENPKFDYGSDEIKKYFDSIASNEVVRFDGLQHMGAREVADYMTSTYSSYRAFESGDSMQGYRMEIMNPLGNNIKKLKLTRTELLIDWEKSDAQNKLVYLPAKESITDLNKRIEIEAGAEVYYERVRRYEQAVTSFYHVGEYLQNQPILESTLVKRIVDNKLVEDKGIKVTTEWKYTNDPTFGKIKNRSEKGSFLGGKSEMHGSIQKDIALNKYVLEIPEMVDMFKYEDEMQFIEQITGTMAHEFGHYIDFHFGMHKVESNFLPTALFNGNNNPMAMATYTNPLTDNLMGVINMSPEVQALNKWLTTPDFPKYGTTVGEQNYLKGYVRYLSNNHELFARAYAQYVMTKLVKAGKIPQRYLTGLQESNKLWGSIEKVSQWQTDNFEPIEKAFDDFFAMYNGMVQNKYDNAVNLK